MIETSQIPHDPALSMSGKRFRTRARKSGPLTVLLERTHRIERDYRELNAFGKFWNVCVLKSGTPVGFARDGKLVSDPRLNAVFIPSRSLIEWCLPAGELRWQAILSRAPLPQGLPEEPVAFSWPGGELPADPGQALEKVVLTGTHVPVGKQEVVSAVALRTKGLIDQTFTEPLGVAELARRLRYSHSVMTRAFRACYGIPPIDYRNRLRIFEALMLLLLRKSDVTGTGLATGFQDPASFYRQFSRILGVSPSNYK